MRFSQTPLAGAAVIDFEPRRDERGLFARIYCAREFAAAGLQTDFPQANISVTSFRGTLRGLHYQQAPYEEVKVVRAVVGAVYDVIVDLRPGSPTFKQWFGVELSGDNGRALYVPAGFAHGFQTLSDDATLIYMMGAEYRPEAARGVRWDDPAFGIDWPIPDPHLSPRDATYSDFRP